MWTGLHIHVEKVKYIRIFYCPNLLMMPMNSWRHVSIRLERRVSSVLHSTGIQWNRDLFLLDTSPWHQTTSRLMPCAPLWVGDSVRSTSFQSQHGSGRVLVLHPLAVINRKGELRTAPSPEMPVLHTVWNINYHMQCSTGRGLLRFSLRSSQASLATSWSF